MALSRQEIDALLKSISLTRSNEVTCDECLQRLAEFAEQSLPGKSIPQGLEVIAHHLSICSECQEEFQALLVALESEE